MEQQFIYMMIFFVLAIVIVIILLFTIGWNNQSQPVTPPTNLPINLPPGGIPSNIPVNLPPGGIPGLIGNLPIYNQPMSDVSQVQPVKANKPIPPIQPADLTDGEPRPKKVDGFNILSIKLLENLFGSIEQIVVSQEHVVDYDQQVKQTATTLANSLCDQSNAETLVKSYSNLNNLLQEYTKIGRDRYLERSTFDELSSVNSDISESDPLFDERSISPSMHLTSRDGNVGKDIKAQAGILTMVINGIFCKCLDLSADSNGSFKTYLGSLNTMLFRYSDVIVNAQWEEANDIKKKALDLAAGAILTNQ
jgi:hypothetical protein